MDSLPGHVEYGERELELGPTHNHVRDALRVLRKQWLMVLIPLVCVTSVVYVLTKRKTPVYEATARIRIAPAGANVTGSELLQQILEGKQPGGIGTQVEILRSPQLMYRAVPQDWIRRKGDPQVVVGQVPNTDVVVLTVYWDDPVECAQIANWLVDRFDQEGQEESRKAIKAALDYVNQKLRKVEPDLDQTARALRDFQQRNQVVQLDAQAGQAVGQLAAAEGKRQEVESTLAQIKLKIPEVEKRFHEAPETIKASRGLAKNPLLANLEGKLQALELKRNELLVEHVETSPVVKAVEQEIKGVQAQIEALVSDELKREVVVTGTTEVLNPEKQAAKDQLISLHVERLAATAQLGALKKQEARYQAVVQALPAKQYELARLQRDYAVTEKSYLNLMEQKQALELSRSAKVSTVTRLSEALPNFQPVSPNMRVNMIMAGMLGLMLGLGLAYVREYLGDTVDTAAHVHSATGLPVIGAIPKLRRRRRAAALHRRDELTPEMEGYHFVASALPMGHRESATRTLLLTSAGTGHGNSTTVANLAVAFAQRQKAVVLVDLDLRKPTLHRLFNVAESPGISDVVAGNKLLAEALHPTAVEGLLVMPAGSARENPIRTLSATSLPLLLQDLANVADVVLIDSPPCVTVTDASIIAPLVDGTILLLRAGDADRRTAQRARTILTTVGASLLGVILNRASVGLEGFSYARRYYRAMPPALGPGS